MLVFFFGFLGGNLPYQEGVGRCPPDKGDTPEGGRGFCRCPPDKGDTPEGGRGFLLLSP